MQFRNMIFFEWCNIMNKIKKYFDNPWRLYSFLTARGLTKWIPDKIHLKLRFRSELGQCLNLDNPKTFNEKIQWLKIYDRKSLYVQLVDKYAVKEWVKNIIGPKYVTKNYAKWDFVDDVDISNLPEKFVLKTNHDCGGIVICDNRDKFDLDIAKKKLSRHLKRNYFWINREWPYKQVKPCVFAEEYLEPNKIGDLPDYKLFCFPNGRIITLLMTNRFTGEAQTETFFDEEWQPLQLTESSYSICPDYPIPSHFEEMKKISRVLSEGFPFLRVDFYESGGRLVFGEMTLYPAAGYEHFSPSEWDLKFGSWIDLSLSKTIKDQNLD